MLLTQSIALQDYAAAIKEYGYDLFQALDRASEEQVTEMTQDPDVAMKRAHRRRFMLEWKKRVQSPHLSKACRRLTPRLDIRSRVSRHRLGARRARL